MADQDRKEGTLRRLFPEKVYGFIHCPLDGRDYFFHKVQLDGCEFGQLKEGDVVTFEVGEGPKGVEAQEVRIDPRREETPLGTETRKQVGLPERHSRFRHK